MESLNRDARKLLPRSLRRLLAEREAQIVEEMRRFPPAVSQALAADLTAGKISPETAGGLRGRGRGRRRSHQEAAAQRGTRATGKPPPHPRRRVRSRARGRARGLPAGGDPRVLRLHRGLSREDPGRARRPRGPEAGAQGPARLLADPARPQPRPVHDHPHGDGAGRAPRQPQEHRLSLARLRRGLPLLLPGGQRASPRPGSRSGARPTATPRACPKPREVVPRDGPPLAFLLHLPEEPRP